MVGAPRLFGTNGIRFRPGVDFGLDTVVRIAEAIGTFFATSPILLAHDGRLSSPTLERAVASGLLGVGLQVRRAGLLPTPALQYGTHKLGYRGAVMITASHNPPEYNGIKVMSADGVEIPRPEEVEIEQLYADGATRRADWAHVGTVTDENRVVETYLDGILDLIDRKQVRARHFTVVLDVGNGAQAVAAPYLLEELGCKVVTLNGQVDGNFPGRGAEPTPDNLAALSETVRATGAELGVAYDGDGDRSLFCDEKGIVHWGDRSGALLAQHVLKRQRGATIVTTVSTSQVVEDVALPLGGRVVRTRVGSIEVSRRMLELDALFGLEENGGCFYGPHLSVRDGAMTTALMLETLATQKVPASARFAEIRRYHQTKTKFPCPAERKEKAVAYIAERARGRVDRTDGVKLWLNDHSWILMRPSGTEPLIRVFAESDDPKTLEAMVRKYAHVVAEATKK